MCEVLNSYFASVFCVKEYLDWKCQHKTISSKFIMKINKVRVKKHTEYLHEYKPKDYRIIDLELVGTPNAP